MINAQARCLCHQGCGWMKIYDKIIRDNKEFQERMNYIINDPVKISLVEQE